MSRSIYVVGLVGMLGCSSVGTGAVSHPATPAVVIAPVASARTAPVAAAPSVPSEPSAPATTALEYHDESESDRGALENAERAIRLYEEFLARAGDSEEYAPAVKRSREQIKDLSEILVFIREGAAQRAAH
ncbi:MAG TPA: hypothetical protein VER96_12760 [Polyangiaceae bacterium]|nr:hypothetical protein [Polyangiaceae bacterium]